MTAGDLGLLEKLLRWNPPSTLIVLAGALSFAWWALSLSAGVFASVLLGGWEMFALGVCCVFWLVRKFIRQRAKRGQKEHR